MADKIDDKGQIRRDSSSTSPPAQGSSSSSGGGGCFVATVIYGTSTAREVELLRAWRDTVLIRHLGGRLFIRLYSILGPRLAYVTAQSQLLQRLLRGVIDFFVRRCLS